MINYGQVLKEELKPAVGCTELVAIAYAAAKAVSVLSQPVEKLKIFVSANIMKNAMGVGIPGTNATGLATAAALGAISGHPDNGFEILQGISQQDIVRAEKFAKECVEVSLSCSDKKLYIMADAISGLNDVKVTIEDEHTNVTKIVKNSKVIYLNSASKTNERCNNVSGLTIDNIFEYVNQATEMELSFLQECVDMNMSVAKYGLTQSCGLQVGKNIYENNCFQKSMPDYAIALAAAAADARMAGCTLPVMSLCGSGNQGITATVPVIAYARSIGYSNKELFRALALSCLITIHVKSYIGKLSPLCGCGVGSSIGTCCAITYMKQKNVNVIKNAVKNMVGDISGIICDGAKSSCALKISTVLEAAFRCSDLAICNQAVGQMDGIVADDAEKTIRQLGVLASRGMANTDKVILEMMINK